MDAYPLIVLPSGFGQKIENIGINGKGPPMLFRLSPVRSLSIQESSVLPHSLQNTDTPPIPIDQSARRLAKRALKQERKIAGENKMGFQRHSRKINMGPATGKERRGRRPKAKVQLPLPNAPKVSPPNPKRKHTKRPKPVGPSTRVGASQNLPITLDSDDEEADDLGTRAQNLQAPALSNPSLLDPDLGHFRYQPDPLSHQSDSSGSKYSPLASTYAPTGFVLRRSLPAPPSRYFVQAPSDRVRESNSASKSGAHIANTRKVIAPKVLIPSIRPLEDTEMSAVRKLATRRQHQSRPSLSVSNEAERGSVNRPFHTINHKRPTTMRDVRASQLFSRVKNPTPAPSQHRSFSPQFDRVPLPRGYVQTPEPAAVNDTRSLPINNSGEKIDSEEQTMTLEEIPDFPMRSKVAQLMAVAPGLPVRDLYHLVIDSKGYFKHARAKAIRMSEPPAAGRHSLKQLPYLPIEQDADGDDIMVKIDPFDPAFEWDNDSPSLEEQLSKPKKRPKQKFKSKQNHSRKKTQSIYISSSSSDSSSRPLKSAKTRATIEVTRPHKQTPTMQIQATKAKLKPKSSSSKSRSTVEVRRVPTINPTHARETSSDRDFVVPDNMMICISEDDDGDHDDDDSVPPTRPGDSDVHMEDDDGLDLDIDMQPPYAFNRGLLKRNRGTRR